MSASASTHDTNGQSSEEPLIKFEVSYKPQKKVYDFRSDTTTIPTPEMLLSIFQAEFGDEVRGEDPTVQRLQDKIVALTGKEAALYVCSGNMSNQLAVRTHVTHNYAKEVALQEVICDSRSHVYVYELGGIAFLSGTQVKPINPIHFGQKHLTAEIIEQHLSLKNDLHHPLSTIIILENTLNGSIYPEDEIIRIRELADRHGIIMHLDGARLWNASSASGISIMQLTKHFDSVSLCLSKGLGAPVGSVLVGSRKFIEKAKQYRKLFGGGWRQAGVIAACGIYAVDNIWPKMKDDHKNTLKLWHDLTAIGLEADRPDTNMLFLNSQKTGHSFETILKAAQPFQTQPPVLMEVNATYGARLVVHHQIGEEGVNAAIHMLSNALKSLHQ